MTAAIQDSAQRHDSDAQPKLHRRRDKAEAAKAAADKARADLSALDDQVKANAAETRDNETALEHARDEVIRLKRAIKASGKSRGKLRAARKKALNVVGKADRKARAAEAKYDQIVLTEMVRREKDNAAARTPAPAADPAPVAEAEER
ncbi:MAG TPA: hypothetical protein VK453_08540 [Micromonosporaceae bacterium]|nr:hypothetical protein [Micromonosporaceae bacterium]